MLKIDILPSTSFAKEEGYYLSGFVSAWISSWLHLKKDEGRQILLILIPCYSYVWGQIQVAMPKSGYDLSMIVFTSMRHLRQWARHGRYGH